MPEQVPFIGRKNEIDRINELIKKWGENQVICIDGVGGIGKTRLLQEIREQQTKKQGIQVTDIIDFDDQNCLNPEKMSRKIATMLDQKVFESFLRAQVDYHKMRVAGVSSERLNQESLAVNQIFSECFNTVSNKKRVLLFLDTTDHLEKGEGVWKDIEVKIPQLKNVIILMAGRNAGIIGESLQKNVSNHIEIINLAPLSGPDSRLYLQQKQNQKHITIESDLAEKLLVLSDGRPILLDLAVEWRTRGISLDWLVKNGLEEIQSPDEGRTQEFEQHLLCHIKELRSPIDELMLLMSYIYPLNVEMLSGLMQEKNAQELFQKAQSYVFVKQLPNGYITLHDEMRRLVQQYLWPEVDPESGRRRWYSELTLKYLTSETKNLAKDIKERKRKLKTVEKEENYTMENFEISLQIQELEQRLWELREQQLYHVLFTNLDEGVNIFVELFDKATKNSRFAFRQKLFEKLASARRKTFF